MFCSYEIIIRLNEQDEQQKENNNIVLLSYGKHRIIVSVNNYIHFKWFTFIFHLNHIQVTFATNCITSNFKNASWFKDDTFKATYDSHKSLELLFTTDSIYISLCFSSL